MFGLLHVTGESMAPTAPAGTRLLALPWPGRWLRTGQMVVARVDAGRLIVKRIDAIDEHGVTLRSDNPDTASAYCGRPLQRQRVIARAFPLGRRSLQSRPTAAS